MTFLKALFSSPPKTNRPTALEIEQMHNALLLKYAVSEADMAILGEIEAVRVAVLAVSL